MSKSGVVGILFSPCRMNQRNTAFFPLPGSMRTLGLADGTGVIKSVVNVIRMICEL
jgi:hypothetical protein